ncbi:MAG: hypothetical protein AB8G95_12770 [Anaerolineae bacterium]
MDLKRYITYVFVCSFVIFAFNRFIIRPWLIGSVPSSFALLVSYSLPNFIEALMGTFAITGLLFVCRSRLKNGESWLADRGVYGVGVLAAGIYVITQELNLHQLGGNNVFDPYDIVASVLGLLVAIFLLMQLGFLADGTENL